MIDITVNRTQYEYRINISGHAGYNPGNDIVCSAVSALTYVLAHAASNLNPDEYELDMSKGNAYIYIFPRDRKDIFLVFDSIVDGYRAIEHKYMKNVKVHG